MAKYKILNADTKHNIYEFLVDKVSDLNSLPKNVGSTVFVVDTNEKYICNNAKEWKILSNNGTSSSDSGANGGDNGSNAGGGGVMYVTMTLDGVSWIADKTFEQITQAINNAVSVLVVQPHGFSGDEWGYFSLETLGPDFVHFKSVTDNLNDHGEMTGVNIQRYIIESTNNVTYIETVGEFNNSNN